MLKTSPTEEADLVRVAQGGDLNAFNRLILSYQDMAFNLAYRMLSDDESAQDATQTAFISAYRNLKGFRGGSFRSWLMRIVTNACFDELRRRKRRPTTPLEPYDPDGEETIESPQWLADDNPGPEELISAKELDKAIQQCLNKLPEDFRSVVILIDIEGMDYLETAEIIKKPLGTIKSRLVRARLRMRSCLQGFAELLPVHLRLGNEERI